MKRLRPWSLRNLAPALLLLAALCALPSPARCEQTLRVGVYNFAPLIFFKDNRAQGFFIDILESIAEKEGWRLQFVPGSWAECLKRLQDGEIDLQPAIAYSEERAKTLDFTKQYLFLDWAVIYRAKGSDIRNILDLNGKKISSLKGSIYTTELESLLRQFDVKAEIINENEYGEVLKDVADGRADAGACTNVYGTLIEDGYDVERTGIVFSAIKIRFAVKKGAHQAVLAALDKHFKELKEDKGSIYYASYNRWLGLSARKTQPGWIIWGLAGLCGALLILGGFAAVLKKAVTQSTRRLNETNAYLVDSEARFRAIFEQAAVGMALASLDGRWLRANPKLTQITGYTQDEMRGMTYEDITSPDDLDRERGNRRLILYGNEDAYFMEKRYIRKGGEPIWVALTVSLVRDQSERPSYFISIVEDITARKRAEKELGKAQRYIRNIIDSMPSAMIGLDREGLITHFNRAAAALSGVNETGAVGRTPAEIFPDLDAHMDSIRRAMDERRPLMLERQTWRAGDGDRLKDIMVYPLVSGEMEGEVEGGVEGAVARIDDVTERARIQQMMIQTEKMLSVGGLAAGMAHEINNPLGIIMASCQNARRRISPDLQKNLDKAVEVGIDLDKVNAFLEAQGLPRFFQGIEEAAARAAEIVRNMLNFSRKSESRRAPYEVSELLDKVILLAGSDYDLKQSYDFRNIEIIREYAPDLGPVIVTETEIEQVFLNILRNAAQSLAGKKDSGVPPRIRISAVKDGPYARIEIEDNGPGMTEETRKRVFEPFFTTKTVGVGTGLGLSVSYFIVTNNHDGEISVKSEPAGGALFTIKLPLASDRA